MAMVILAVGLLSIAVAQISAIKVSSRSKNLQQAMLLARERLDELKALPDDNALLQLPAVIDDPGNPLSVALDPGDLTTYTRSTQIIPGDPAPGQSRLVVTVVWDNAQGGGPSQVRLTSIKRVVLGP